MSDNPTKLYRSLRGLLRAYQAACAEGDAGGAALCAVMFERTRDRWREATGCADGPSDLVLLDPLDAARDHLRGAT